MLSPFGDAVLAGGADAVGAAARPEQPLAVVPLSGHGGRLVRLDGAVDDAISVFQGRALQPCCDEVV